MVAKREAIERLAADARNPDDPAYARAAMDRLQKMVTADELAAILTK